MRLFKNILFVGALLAPLLVSQAIAGETQSREKMSAIPYPNRSLYLEEGIVGSLGFGLYKVNGKYVLDGNSYRPSAVFQWQGEGSYYYKPFISGGVSSKIIAGEPTENSTMVDNRYMTFVRFHHRIHNFAIYAGPTVGLHNLTFEADSIRERQKDIDISIPALRYGLEIGLGLRLNKALGLTSGVEIEHSITEEFLHRYSLGVALDILYLWPHIGELANGFFLLFEYKYARVDDHSNLEKENETIFMLGGVVAF